MASDGKKNGKNMDDECEEEEQKEINWDVKMSKSCIYIPELQRRSWGRAADTGSMIL